MVPSEEDARLMIAAPDLLAACEEASAELRRAPNEANTFDGYIRIVNAFEILAAATKKAKGE